VVINYLCVLILTDNKMSVRSNDHIVAIIKLMLGNALEKELHAITIPIWT
jgi:hypothetical protein